MTLVGYLACFDIKSGKVFLTILLNIAQIFGIVLNAKKERLSVIGIVPFNPLSHGLDRLMTGYGLFEQFIKQSNFFIIQKVGNVVIFGKRKSTSRGIESGSIGLGDL